MSEQTISEEVSEKLKRRLSSEFNKQTRKEAQTNRPQILQLHDLKFINDTIEAIGARGKGSKSIKGINLEDKDLLDRARQIAKTAQDNFVAKKRSKNPSISNVTLTNEYLKIAEISALSSIAKDIKEGRSFIIGSFSKVGEIKRDIIDMALKGKSKSLIKRIKSKVDRGHGVAGGSAISQVQIAQAAAILGEQGISLKDNKEIESYLINQFEEYGIDLGLVELIKNVFVDYKSLVTPDGELLAEYIPIITFQDFYSNRGIDAREEKIILNIIRNFFNEVNVLTLSGSATLKQKIERVAILDPFIAVSGKGLTVKTKTAPIKASDNKEKRAKSKDTKDTKLKVTKRRKKGSVPRVKQSKTVSSMFTIATLINAKLPATLQKNMQSPRLNYRTGQFANSVSIADVAETTKGFPSFGYTYDKFPYQTFEVGGAQGTPERDPRSLIDASIREIAAEMAVGRFFTRRL